MTTKGDDLRDEIKIHATEFGKNYKGELANFKREYLREFRRKFGDKVKDPDVKIDSENLEIVGKFYVYTWKNKNEQLKTEKPFHVPFKIVRTD